MVKEGFYEGGIFWFIIEFPWEFTKEKPQITFKGNIYSPILDQNGCLDFEVRLKAAFSKLDLWKRKIDNWYYYEN